MYNLLPTTIKNKNIGTIKQWVKNTALRQEYIEVAVNISLYKIINRGEWPAAEEDKGRVTAPRKGKKNGTVTRSSFGRRLKKNNSLN